MKWVALTLPPPGLLKCFGWGDRGEEGFRFHMSRKKW